MTSLYPTNPLIENELAELQAKLDAVDAAEEEMQNDYSDLAYLGALMAERQDIEEKMTVLEEARKEFVVRFSSSAGPQMNWKAPLPQATSPFATLRRTATTHHSCGGRQSGSTPEDEASCHGCVHGCNQEDMVVYESPLVCPGAPLKAPRPFEEDRSPLQSPPGSPTLREPLRRQGSIDPLTWGLDTP